MLYNDKYILLLWKNKAALHKQHEPGMCAQKNLFNQLVQMMHM